MLQLQNGGTARDLARVVLTSHLQSFGVALALSDEDAVAMARLADYLAMPVSVGPHGELDPV